MLAGADDKARAVVVVGSVNADYVLRVARRPEPGETVADALLEVYPGGKGANQALAAARAGATVELVARVGDDPIGRSRVADLLAGRVGTAWVRPTPGERTGMAFITVTPDGQNAITVARGANACLLPSDVEDAADLLGEAAVLVVQLEVPLETVVRAVELAGPATAVVINCAPWRQLPEYLLKRTDLLVANENEGAALSGCLLPDPAGARRAASAIRSLGPRAVVITLGPAGAVLVAEDLDLVMPAPEAAVVDTTGAGDAFVGALSARLAASDGLADAVAFGVAVGTATTEQMGPVPIVPPDLLEHDGSLGLRRG
jgi:ribokinase